MNLSPPAILKLSRARAAATAVRQTLGQLRGRSLPARRERVAGYGADAKLCATLNLDWAARCVAPARSVRQQRAAFDVRRIHVNTSGKAAPHHTFVLQFMPFPPASSTFQARLFSSLFPCLVPR
jgi:hypothetical protein